MNNYKKIILDNGVTLYLYQDTSMKQVFVNYIIKYGLRGEWFKFNLDNKEYDVGSGYAHYLEHILLKSSEQGDLTSYFTQKGYDNNAYTSKDYTNYYFCGTRDIKESLKYLIEAIDNPIFTEEDIEKERKAIIEECKLHDSYYENKLALLIEQNLFGGIQLYDDSLISIGNVETQKNIKLDNLKICYDAFYTDNNKVLVIGGNLDEKEVVNYLNGIYKNIERHESRVILPEYDYSLVGNKSERLYKSGYPDLYGIGLKIKVPEEIDIKDAFYTSQLLLKLNYSIVFSNGLVDRTDTLSTGILGNYIEFINTVVTRNGIDYYTEFLNNIRYKHISNKDFEDLKNLFLSEKLRLLDNKYIPLLNFGDSMYYTEDYSDIDYFKNLEYDKFKYVLDTLDYSNYVRGKLTDSSNKDRKLAKVKKIESFPFNIIFNK